LKKSLENIEQIEKPYLTTVNIPKIFFSHLLPNHTSPYQ
jgi:hypothetical protein